MKMLVKKTIYSRPHDMENKFNLAANATTKNVTSFPQIMNDEGLGDPISYNAHPEHSSFSEYVGPNCYPDSHVNKMFTQITCTMTKGCIETDKIRSMPIMVIPYFIAFKESYEAIDELSSNEIQDILELQKEATDRQGYPIYNGTDLTGESLALGADVPGLTAGQNIEGIGWSWEILYDMLQYGTNKGKLKATMGNMQWRTLTRDRPVRFNFRNNVPSKVKMINPYTLCGFIIGTPNGSNQLSTNQGVDFSAIDHVVCNVI